MMKQKPKKATYRQADTIHSLTSPEISIPLHFPPDSSMSMGFERIHLHHLDGNHDNWKRENLEAIHESCHDYLHMSKRVI